MDVRVIHGDCLGVLPGLEAGSVRCCVTSPPYFGLRDYGCDGQIGLEPTPEEYVKKLVAVFREVRRVLSDDGTLWLNLGDSYATSPGKNNGNLVEWASLNARGGGHRAGDMETPYRRVPPGLKPKDLIGIPWRVAFALQADGWYLRSDIIWHKPNPMPESVRDRPTKAHEYVFLLSKSDRYYYDAEAIRERATIDPVSSARRNRADSSAVGTKGMQGEPFGQSGKGLNAEHRRDTRNARSVWSISPRPCPESHFAVMPTELADRCVLAGSAPGDAVLDPFCGAGTTMLSAYRAGRRGIGIELSAEYIGIANRRLADAAMPLLDAFDEPALSTLDSTPARDGVSGCG